MNKSFYHVGGALPINSPSYVEQDADMELYNNILAGKYCYVLKYRQVGKSSLRVHCSQQLKLKKFKCINIDLTSFGSNDITAEKWYFSFLYTIVKQLNLSEDNFIDYWDNHEKLTVTSRFALLIDEFILRECKEKIVIFVDEIDSVLGIKNFSTDDFFALIRGFYNLRSEDSRYNRLIFVLLGVASADDLMRDASRTPFNIALNVKMGQLKLEESYQLIDGLNNQLIDKKEILKKIFEYTSGTSYLTQKTLDYVSKNPINLLEDIDQIVDELFIKESFNDTNIKNIHNRILNNKTHSLKMLYLISRILNEKYVEKLSSSKTLMYLKLSGLIKVENKRLVYNNLIYKKVFNHIWLDKMIDKIDRPIVKSLQKWIEHRRSVVYLLKGEELSNVRIWANDRNDLSAIEHEYLGLCIEEENKKKSNKKFKILGFAFIIILLIIFKAFYLKLNETESQVQESKNKRQREIELKLKEISDGINPQIDVYRYIKIPKSIEDKNITIEEKDVSILNYNIFMKNKALTSLIDSSIRMPKSDKKYWLNNLDIMTNKNKEELFNVLQYYAYFERADDYSQKEEYKSAIRFYRKAININSKKIGAYFELGDTYAQLDEYNQSINCYLRVIEIDSKNEKAFYNIGNIYFEIKQYAKAIDSYADAIKINLKNDNAYVKMADIYYRQEKYQKAKELYTKALKINPNNSKARPSIKIVSSILEKYEIRKEDYYKKGIFYNKQGQYKKAINSFIKAIEIDSLNYKIYDEVAKVYYKLEKYDKVIKNCQKSQDINITNSESYKLLGNTYYKLNKYKESILNYQKSLKLNSKNNNTIYSNLHGAYIHIFHAQLINYNKLYDDELEREYINIFKDKKEYFSYYEVLKILEKVYNEKKREISSEDSWLKNYKNIVLDSRGLDYIRIEWMEKSLKKKKEKIRFTLVNVIEKFKNHVPKLQYFTFTKAILEAKKEKKIVMVIVSEIGCHWCRKLYKKLEDEEIKKIIYYYFKVVKVNDKHIPLNEIVEDTPSLLFYEPSNKQLLNKVSGIENTIDDLLNVLKEEVKRGKEKDYLRRAINDENRRIKYTRDGWVYLGEYKNGKWKTQNFEFNKSSNPFDLKGSYQTAKFRQNIRIRLGRKGKIISGLKKDDDVKIIDVEVNKKFYIWAKIKY